MAGPPLEETSGERPAEKAGRLPSRQSSSQLHSTLRDYNLASQLNSRGAQPLRRLHTLQCLKLLISQKRAANKGATDIASKT